MMAPLGLVGGLVGGAVAGPVPRDNEDQPPEILEGQKGELLKMSAATLIVGRAPRLGPTDEMRYDARMREMDSPTRTILDGTRARRLLRSYELKISTASATRSLRCENPVVRIGSQPRNDVHLADETVSRLHAEICVDEHGYRLRDLGSRNGTFVDGVRALDLYLRPGARMELGESTLIFMPSADEVAVEASESDRLGPMVGKSVAMRELFALVLRAAPTNATVLLEGESGTGKELIAQALHAHSKRAGGPFIVFDCGAVSAGLLESEFFGHEKGAFTGATERRIGCFEEADGGTLFIDELGELPLDLQPKLLRTLEQGQIRRVGGTQVIDADVRVVAATNRELAQEVNSGTFREDLYYRLAVITLRTPPLRERLDDLEILVRHFLDEGYIDPSESSRAFSKISAETWARLRGQRFRGNVRELRNIIQRALVLSDGELKVDPPTGPATKSEQEPSLQPDLELPLIEQKQRIVAAFERRYLETMLARHEGNISRAARGASMDRMYFKRLMRKHGL
ncbi:MAG: sigma 54-dependent Fis family transcriptional regulator [Deltaproteobacteria bacterium]|nr:sigma 54-dependent Fis family transcriptional regulator [Deltaproteobacteria bacterium]